MSVLSPLNTISEDAARAQTSGGEAFSAEIGGIHLHFGAGTLDLVGPVSRTLGGARVLVVTDPGVRAAGHADRAIAFLKREGYGAGDFGLRPAVLEHLGDGL